MQEDIIKIETGFVLTDKDGLVIEVTTPEPEIIVEDWFF